MLLSGKCKTKGEGGRVMKLKKVRALFTDVGVGTTDRKVFLQPDIPNSSNFRQ